MENRRKGRVGSDSSARLKQLCIAISELDINHLDELDKLQALTTRLTELINVSGLSIGERRALHKGVTNKRMYLKGKVYREYFVDYIDTKGRMPH